MDKTIYGKRCKRWRITHTNYTQQNIADELEVTVAAISRFETGRADNMYMLCWYLEHGMPLTALLIDESHSIDHVACFVGDRHIGKRYFEDRMKAREI